MNETAKALEMAAANVAWRQAVYDGETELGFDEWTRRWLATARMGACQMSQTPPRSVRVPDDLWQAAAAEAERRGETVSAVIVRSLTRYVKRGDVPPDQHPSGRLPG